MARPNKFNCTPQDISKIETMASFGLTIEKIAAVFGVDRKTMNRHTANSPALEEAIERGRAKAEFNVSKAAYDMAISGKVPAMTMFWLKCRAKWREVIPIEHSGEVGVKTFADFMAAAGPDDKDDE
jgi:hypothetical protein